MLARACLRRAQRPDCASSFSHSLRAPIPRSAARRVSTLDRVKPVQSASQPSRRQWLRESTKFTSLEHFISYLNSLESGSKADDDLAAAYRGKKFELLALESFRTLGFDFKHVGMRGDGGVDLSGTWLLPDREITVSAQCKREKKRLGARALRELEGSVLHSSTQAGLVISYSHYSTAALNHARASPLPLVLSVLGTSSIIFHRLQTMMVLAISSLIHRWCRYYQSWLLVLVSCHLPHPKMARNGSQYSCMTEIPFINRKFEALCSAKSMPFDRRISFRDFHGIYSSRLGETLQGASFRALGDLLEERVPGTTILRNVPKTETYLFRRLLTECAMAAEVSMREAMAGVQREFAAHATPSMLDLVAKSIEDVYLSGIESNAPKIGGILPPFALPDTSGRIWRSEELLQARGLVVIFYRGKWCSYCQSAIHIYSCLAKKLAERGYMLVAISPQLPQYASEMTKLCPDVSKTDVLLLHDKDNGYASSLRIAYEILSYVKPIYASQGITSEKYNGDPDEFKVPLSGTFVVGRDGKVRFAHAKADPANRAEPKDILAAL